MRAEVRDDIISLKTFIEARFYYEKYIEIINQCGGYCFLEQFDRFFKNEGGKYLAKKMEKAGLIKLKKFNKYKYVYLSDPALKYLTYKDSPKDFSDTPKNLIPIKKLKSTPSNKVLFFSTMKFHYYQKEGPNLYNKKMYLNLKRKTLKKYYNSQETRIKELIKELLDLVNVNNDNKLTYDHCLKDIDNLPILNDLEHKEKEINNEIKDLHEEIDSKIIMKGNLKILLKRVERQKIEMQVKKSIKFKLDRRIAPLIETIEKNNRTIEKMKKELKALQTYENGVEKRIEATMNKIVNLHDRSKIIFQIGGKIAGNKVENIIINFMIFDTGSSLSPQRYSELLKDLLDTLDKDLRWNNNFKKITITFITYDKNERSKKAKKIHSAIFHVISPYGQHNVKIDLSILEIDYIKKYKEFVQNSISYVNEKDIGALEALKTALGK